MLPPSLFPSRRCTIVPICKTISAAVCSYVKSRPVLPDGFFVVGMGIKIYCLRRNSTSSLSPAV